MWTGALLVDVLPGFGHDDPVFVFDDGAPASRAPLAAVVVVPVAGIDGSTVAAGGAAEAVVSAGVDVAGSGIGSTLTGVGGAGSADMRSARFVTSTPATSPSAATSPSTKTAPIT